MHHARRLSRITPSAACAEPAVAKLEPIKAINHSGPSRPTFELRFRPNEATTASEGTARALWTPSHA